VSGGRGEEKTPSLARGIFLLLAGFILLVDQGTKFLAQTYLLPGTSRPVVANFFHLTLVENQGIAFGLLEGADRFLLVVITLSIAVLFTVGFRVRPPHVKTQWGIGLILGGAAGNWMDRIRFGAVIDFLDFRIWPVFNVADSAITIGVGIFLLDLLRVTNKSKSP
jgi:signal peptidase II